jgi:hypothetical protein
MGRRDHLRFVLKGTEMKVKVKFYPRDAWMGFYLEKPSHARIFTEPTESSRVFHKLVICVLPCLPVVIEWKTTTRVPPQWCSVCEEITDHTMYDCPSLQ